MATKKKPVPPNNCTVPRSAVPRSAVPNRFGLRNIQTTKGKSCGCGK